MDEQDEESQQGNSFTMQEALRLLSVHLGHTLVGWGGKLLNGGVSHPRFGKVWRLYRTTQGEGEAYNAPERGG